MTASDYTVNIKFSKEQVEKWMDMASKCDQSKSLGIRLQEVLIKEVEDYINNYRSSDA